MRERCFAELAKILNVNDALYFLISYANGCKGFRDLMVFADLYKSVDSARPQSWSDKCRNELGFNPEYFVWSYQENTVFGKPVNLAAAVLEKLAEVLAYEYPERKKMIAETLKKGGTMET